MAEINKNLTELSYGRFTKDFLNFYKSYHRFLKLMSGDVAESKSKGFSFGGGSR